MELSKRLQAVADFVTPGNLVADIGCDHGYISIYLRKEEISPRVIALDVNKGPLEKAKEHIEKYGCTHIETRLSNGFEALKIGEVETAICAGMGGRLVLRMMESHLDLVKHLKECILQPQSELSIVRKQLIAWGFEFLEENMIFEDGKYYPIMKITWNPNAQKVSYMEWEYEYGPLLIRDGNPLLLKFLNWKYNQYTKIYEQLNTQEGIEPKDRLKELEKEREYIQFAKEALESR